jgi:hypothetical protein
MNILVSFLLLHLQEIEACRYLAKRTDITLVSNSCGKLILSHLLKIAKCHQSIETVKEIVVT